MEDSFTTEVAPAKSARKGPPTANVLAKKALLVRRSRAGALFEIYFEDGGQVPEVLSGKYTREHAARTAADKYLAGR